MKLSRHVGVKTEKDGQVTWTCYIETVDTGKIDLLAWKARRGNKKAIRTVMHVIDDFHAEALYECFLRYMVNQYHNRYAQKLLKRLDKEKKRRKSFSYRFGQFTDTEAGQAFCVFSLFGILLILIFLAFYFGGYIIGIPTAVLLGGFILYVVISALMEK